MPESVEYRSWDITENYPYSRDEGFAAVVNCAGSVSEWGSYKDMYRANVLGTQNVLKAFEGAGLFVQISSGSVYGSKGSKSKRCEDAPYPASYMNHYSTTKMLGEMAVKASKHPNRVILRPHIVYGPGDTTLLPRMMRARRAGRFLVLGDGRNVLSLTHVGNIALAVELLVRREGFRSESGLEIFNVCDSRTVTLNQIAATLEETMGWGEKVVHVNRTVAWGVGWVLEKMYEGLRIKRSPILIPYVVEQMSHDFTMDITKAHRMFGYTPQHEYPDGFREVRDWLASGDRIGSRTVSK
jgi:nucleoside-diphosphate-sugar epimerase